MFRHRALGRVADQLTKHKHFQWSFKLSNGDIQLLKLFRQTVPQHWPGSGKTAVTELLAGSLDHPCSVVSKPQRIILFVQYCAILAISASLTRFCSLLKTCVTLQIIRNTSIAPIRGLPKPVFFQFRPKPKVYLCHDTQKWNWNQNWAYRFGRNWNFRLRC